MNTFNATANRAVQLCAGCLGAVFLFSGVAYLCLGHWPVTHHDFWRIYDVCLNHSWLESALRKHNGHSLFFPSLIWLADLRFFHGNQQVVFYVGLILLVIATGLLLIPVWRDNTVDFTAKIIATLVVIVGNFWMGRAHITASGGFNSNASLMMAGAEVSFICLPFMHAHSARFWSATFAVIAGGFVASFSFGVGLATWPVLLLLAWSLRLPWRSFVLITVAAVAAAIVFLLLPPHVRGPAGLRTLGISVATPTLELSYLCWLLSAPIFNAAFYWRVPGSTGILPSFFALMFGMVALVVAGREIVCTVIRRDLARSTLGLIGLALIAFNLTAMALIVFGRSDHFGTMPFELFAPRYFFHSTLFWMGLLLVAIQRGGSTSWVRWPVYLLVLAVSLLALPSHYKDGIRWRQVKDRAEAAATSPVNGVRDDQQTRILSPAEGMDWIYRVAEQLKQSRLDMFAEGLQDWIGLTESTLFNGRHRPEGLRGRCRITGTVPSDHGEPAARIAGVAWTKRKTVPKNLVIINPAGIVCGVARASANPSFTNRIFYLNKFARNMGFLGYIRNYDPTLQYTIRSADGGALSDEKILVPPASSPPDSQ